MRIDGGCHCGAVRFEAEVDGADVSVCHCTDCQSLTGTAFRTTATAARAPRLLAGAPAIYVKTGANGTRLEQHFCGACGSPLFVRAAGGDEWGVRWGAIRQRAALVPSRAIWRRRVVPWLAGVPGLPGAEGDAP